MTRFDEFSRFDYKGCDLRPVIHAMRQWDDKHASTDGPSLRLKCGRVSELQLASPACGDPIGARDTTSRAGPGDLDGIVRAACADHGSGI